MSRLTETLIAAGWVETTLGECRLGEEVLLTQAGHIPRALRVTQPAEWGGDKGAFVNTSDGCARLDTTPVLRAPRPEYPVGTVALVRRKLILFPDRAFSYAGGWTLEDGSWVESADVEVLRVLLLADQDTPPIEVTDEMVGAAFVSLTGDGTVRWAEGTRDPRGVVREAVEAALGANA